MVDLLIQGYISGKFFYEAPVFFLCEIANKQKKTKKINKQKKQMSGKA